MSTIIPLKFQRTSCTCAECVKCCYDQPGPLGPGDFERIAEHLHEPLDKMAMFFWASPGALVMSRDLDVRMIRTITPKRHQGRCVFLSADNRCVIHKVAPFGCAYFDTHQSQDEYMERAQWLYSHIENSVPYQAIRARLPRATSWNPRF